MLHCNQTRPVPLAWADASSGRAIFGLDYGETKLMAGLGATLINLARYRQLQAASKQQPLPYGGVPHHLIETPSFGSNPGNLRMWSYIPDALPRAAPLVVVLHGCTQSAASYDLGSGWSSLAAQFGFAVLLPEQQRANNPNLCFNWFVPEDMQRESGEMLSIRQMIEHMIDEYGIDRQQIFVTGLSAGAATSVGLLACYPELFVGGAAIAGLPYGAAKSTQEALGAMFQGVTKPGPVWGDLVRKASAHQGPWPRLSIWHGTADHTVIPGNAEELAKQWLDLHQLPPEPTSTEMVGGFPHRVWLRDGKPVVDSYLITGMAHGTPLDLAAADPIERCGAVGPHLLDVGISSTALIARSWGLIGARKAAAQARRMNAPAPSQFDLGGVINKALKAAGLVK